MKKWFNIIVYISLIFLAYKLYKADYLKIPQVYNYYYLCLSLILLCIGMISNTVNWSSVLKVYGYPVSYSKGLVAVGLAIFTKYIPGKLLMILGRAEYISQEYSFPRKTTSTLSLITQLLSIWAGLTLGVLGIIILGEEKELKILVACFFFYAVLLLLIFTPLLNKITSKVAKQLGKLDFNIPVLEFKQTLKVIPYFILNWGFWCLSFYFLCISLTQNIQIPLEAGLGFALGGSVGIISIITPGGIGVREGVIASFLLVLGLESSDATTIAVTSRLWFLVGEVFIFITALYFKNRKI